MELRQAARVLLDELDGAIDGKRPPALWSGVADAMEQAPNAFGQPTPLQMLRAAMHQLAGSMPHPPAPEREGDGGGMGEG